MSHYVLVPKSEPIVLDEDETTQRTCREELEKIYETFAELYPNSRLSEEHRERDQLLAQATAIKARQQQVETRKSSGIARLFQFWKSSETDTETHPIPSEDDLLEYYNEKSTESSMFASQLDIECIPQEAHSAARFHLASMQNKGFSLIRACEDNALPSSSSSKAIAIVGIGRIVEFSEGKQQDQPVGASLLLSAIKETSDRDDLLAYCHETKFELSHVRATSVGPNFLAISWGLNDGVTVLYRRMSMPTLPKVGWESVAMIAPTRATLDSLNASGELLVEDTSGIISSSLLQVTDMIPTLVEHPEGDANPPAATIARSLLGGYLEYIPLTPRLWYGPPLTPENHKHKPRPARKRKRRRDESIEHYAFGKLFNISGSNIVSLSTAPHHLDIMSLDGYKLQHANTSGRKFVLAACGMNQQGGEVITFWQLTIRFVSSDDSFTPEVAFMETLVVGTAGPEVSLLASDAILKQWRKPRRVRLRNLNCASQDAGNQSDTAQQSSNAKRSVTFLSVPAPITCLRFKPSRRDSAEKQESTPMLAALDWNGGITLVNCLLLDQAAMGNASFENRNLGSLCLVQLPRSVAMDICSKSGVPQLASMHWGTVKDKERKQLMYLAVVTMDSQVHFLHLSNKSKQSMVVGGWNLGSLIDGLKYVAISGSNKDNFFFLVYTGFPAEVSLCCMQSLDDSSIVRSLAETGRHAEAIVAAQRLDAQKQAALVDLVDNCRKFLWEKERNVQCFAEIRDDKYIVAEAQQIFQRDDRRIDVDIARQVVDVAVNREAAVAGTRVASSVSNTPRESVDIGRSQPSDSSSFELGELLVWLGTYTLLCEIIYKCPESFSHFKLWFLHHPPEQIAAHVASKGDVVALTLLFIRHRNKLLPTRLDMLNRIPVTVPVSSYCHLLPVYRPKANKTKYFLPLDGRERLLCASELSDYMDEQAGFASFVDPADREAVLNNEKIKANGKVESLDDDIEQIAEWYLERAQQIQTVTGDLSAVLGFCEQAFARLNHDPSDSDIPSSEVKRSATLGRLHAISTCSHYLNRMLNEGVLVPADRQLPMGSSVNMTAERLRSIGLSELLSMILGKATDSLSFFSKYSTYVKPLALIPDLDSESREPADEEDQPFLTYCKEIVSRALPTRAGSEFTLDSLCDALAICATVANASRTTIRKSERIIKDKTILMNLVTSTFEATITGVGEKTLTPDGIRFVLNLMWEMYECLPRRVKEASDTNTEDMHQRADGLFCQLVATDLLSTWHPNRTFALGLELKSLTGQLSPQEGAAGMLIVTELCRGFCQIVGSGSDQSLAHVHFARLGDFFVALDELNRTCFRSSLDYRETLQNYLFRPLLEQHHCNLLAMVLGHEAPGWVDKTKVQGAVLGYMNDVMLGEDPIIDDARIEGVTLCQDILGPFFPEIFSAFDDVRRFVDAASFIRNILLPGTAFNPISPRTIRDIPPFDVIENVMIENPKSVVEGCTDWLDPSFADEAVRKVCHHFKAQISSSPPSTSDEEQQSSDLPPLPGGAIFHLAGILGLNTISSQLILRCRISHHALNEELYGAAAAVCMSLICDPSLPWEGDPDLTVRLKVVADVVKAEGYSDVHIKKELCTAVLLRCPARVSVHASSLLDSIAVVYYKLESESIRKELQRNIDGASSGRTGNEIDQKDGQLQSNWRKSDLLVFRAAGIFSRTAKTLAGVPVNATESSSYDKRLEKYRPSDRVYKYILSNYATDVHELFLELHSQLLIGADNNDPLLHTICRLVVFWCVSECIRTEASSHGQEHEEANERALLAFGTSLLLHIQDKTSGLSLADELQGIVERETGQALEHLRNQPGHIQPDQEIVQRLMGRGYSENGARRAAITTQNESYEKALTWAITYSLDPRFDDPIVILKSEDGVADPQYVNETNVHRIKLALSWARSKIESKNLSPHVSSDDGHAASEKEKDAAKVGAALKRKGNKMSTSSRVTHIPESKIPRPSASRVSKLNVATRKSAPDSDKRKDDKVPLSVPSKQPQRRTHQMSPSVQAHPGLQNDNVATTTVAALKENSKAGNAVETESNSKSLPSSLMSDADREALKKQGLSVHKEMATAVSNLDSDERRQLLEEGRKYMAEVKRAPQCVPNEIRTPNGKAKPLINDEPSRDVQPDPQENAWDFDDDFDLR